MNPVNSAENGNNGNTWKVKYKPIFGVGQDGREDREEVGRELLKAKNIKLALRFVRCRGGYHVHQCGNCSKIELSGSRCESRICPECGEKRMNRVIAQNIDFLDLLPTNPKGKKRATLLTLTVKNVPDSRYERDIYGWLVKSFNIFLKHPRIKKHFRGGIYAIETKRPLEGYVSKSGHRVAPGRTWNVHIHALVDADYIHWQAVRGVWKSITGGVHTDMRAVKASVPALVEVLKYAVKPPNLGDAKSYVRFLEVTKGLRLYNTFGTFRGHFQLSRKAKKKCPICGTDMRYCFDIGPREALRYRQYLQGGPPVDAFGYFNDVGLPESINRLVSAGPFFKGKKQKEGVDA